MALCKPRDVNFLIRKVASTNVFQTFHLSSITSRWFLERTCSKTMTNTALKYCQTKSCIQRKQNIGLSELFISRHLSSHKGSFIAKFSEEIDLDALREQKIKEHSNTGSSFHVHNVVKQILSEKCDEAIKNLSAEDKKKLKVIQLEHDFLFSEGYAIPSPETMTSENWLEALNLSSKQRRLRYYISFQKKTFKKENFKKKKRALSEIALQNPPEKKPMVENKIFIKTYNSAMKRWSNHRLSASMRFGIPLVLDMDYADFMQNREIKNTADQVQDLYCLNRKDEELPFHLHLTGCPDNNPVFRTLQLLMQDDPHFMTTVTSQSYLDLFDRDKLVYLSPNGRQVLRQFDPNTVYIIGAYNDKATQQPVSFARAKEQSIRCQRLPLDEHLSWNMGSKALTLNQIMSIMTAVKNKKSWPEAFKAIPSRKLSNERR